MSFTDDLLSYERLQAAVAAAGLGIWDLNPQTGDLRWSARAKQLLGVPATAAVDLPLFWQCVHPDDRAATEAAVSAALTGPGELDIEYRTQPGAAEAAPRWLRATGQAHFDADQRPVRLVGTLTDVTASKYRAQEFTALVNTVAQLAWMAEADGHIYWYNEPWFAYTGTTLAEMQGWGWANVHHPDHREQVVAFVQQAWATSQPWELTFPLRSHSGEYRWFLTRAVPMLDANGQIRRWFGTNTDVTEMRQLQDQLTRSYQDLELKVTFRTLQLEQEVRVLRARLGE